MSEQTRAKRPKPSANQAGSILVGHGSQLSSGRDLAALAFKHLRFTVAVFVSVMILSVLFVYLSPPIYEASSKVLVERGKRPTQRSDVLGYTLEPFEVITSEIEIIKSRTVAEDVVDRLGLAERPLTDSLARRVGDGIQDLLDGLGLVTRLERREKLVRSLQRGLRVEPAPQSSVLVITYGSESPTDAEAIVRAATESYLVQHRKIFSVDTVTFFEERVQELSVELAELRERKRRETDPSQSESLDLEVTVLEKTYTFYRDKLNTARAEMVADESLVNVRIIDNPVVPARAARSRLFYLFLAAVGGIILSISLASIREYFDHNVYSERDVSRYLDVTVIGSVAFVDTDSFDPAVEGATGASPAGISRNRQELS